MKNNTKTLNRKLLWLTSLVCLTPILMGIMLWQQLPAQIPIHFDFAGEPDQYASKTMVVFGIPLLMAILNVVTHVLLNNDPKQQNSAGILRMVSKWCCPAATFIMVPITLLFALGMETPIHVVVPIFVGILLIFYGNYLPKCRQNYTLGIRLPWTLHDEDNWNKTHRLAGYLWIFGGLVMILCAFAPKGWLPLLCIIMAVLMAVPSIYSWMLYKYW